MAPFDIQELLDLPAYDELELDTLGDRKTALFIIISDTDDTFNFLVLMAYTQLFNLLCEKADDVYGGRLPVHVRCLLDEFANIGQIPKFGKSTDAKPGDLIFFTGTYDTPGVSHVGIYVGNGMMIAAGDPIGYSNLNTSYWQSHFYTFGRLPNP